MLAYLILSVVVQAGKYIVFFEDQEYARSAFGSFDSLVNKHREILTGDSRMYSDLTPLHNLNGYIATISDHALKQIKQQPETVYVEADQEVTLPQAYVAPTGYITQSKVYSWGLDRVDGILNGKFTYPAQDGNGTIIYILDTGVNARHLDFSPTQSVHNSRVLRGISFVSGETTTDDFNGHGTHVSGTAAGTYSGIAKKALIKPVKVLGQSGSGTVSSILSGFEYVIKDAKGKKAVINISIGSGVSTAFNLAARKTVQSGVPVIAAAGNENQDACNTSPSSEPLVISVGATDKADDKAEYSNYGSCVDILAPGTDIVSSDYQVYNGLVTLSGTSMASPHVTGITAVLLSQGVPVSHLRSKLLSLAQKDVIAGFSNDTPNYFAIV